MAEQKIGARSLPSRLGVIVVLAAVSGSCLVGRVWTVDYKFDASALRSGSGETALSTLSTRHVGDEVDLIAADERAEFAFRIEPGRIQVSAQNRGAEAFLLDLAGASYIDASGQTHRLVVIDPETAEGRDLEVQPGSTTRLSLWPKDWTRDGPDGRPSVWKGDSPLGGSTIAERSREEALDRRRQDIGKSFEVILPIRISDARVLYRFRFTVSELVARRTWWA